MKMMSKKILSGGAWAPSEGREVYETPEVTVVALEAEDIVTASNNQTQFVPASYSNRPSDDF